MKKYFFTVLLSLVCILSKLHAQNEVQNNIAIFPYMIQQVEEIPLSSLNMLENRMGQILSKNGVAASKGFNSRFVMVPNITVLTRDIVGTAPPKIAVTLEVVFYIGDGITGLKYGSKAITTKGVGRNENKAYMSAFKNIKSDNKELQNLISEARQRIVSYYENNCDIIIKEAETFAEQNQYERAMQVLYSVPSEKIACFNKSRDKMAQIFQKGNSFFCKSFLDKAKATWNSTQTRTGADEAASYLALVSGNNSCGKEKEKLLAEMAKSINKTNEQEWNYLELEQKMKAKSIQERNELYTELIMGYLKNRPTPIYNIKGWY